MSDQEKKFHGESKRSNVVLDLFSDVISFTASILKEKLDIIVENKKKKIGREIFFIVTLLVGSIFSLVGLALFISEYLAKGNWLGYGIVGLLLIFIALIFKKD